MPKTIHHTVHKTMMPAAANSQIQIHHTHCQTIGEKTAEATFY